jgi:hypothetical protein
MLLSPRVSGLAWNVQPGTEVQRRKQEGEREEEKEAGFAEDRPANPARRGEHGLKESLAQFKSHAAVASAPVGCLQYFVQCPAGSGTGTKSRRHNASLQPIHRLNGPGWATLAQ